MLDEYKKNIRKPNPEELRLIKFLVQKASLNMSEGWERSLDRKSTRLNSSHT